MKKLKDTGEPLYPCTLLAMPKDSKYRDEIRRLIDWGASPILLSVRYKFSNEQFTFALPTDFVDQKQRHVSYTGTGAIGVVPRKLGLLQLVYNYESSFHGKGAKNLCTPVSGSVSSICRSVATEAPDHTIKNIIQLEARAFIGTSFGLAPIISGDLRSKTVAIDLPIYAFKAKDGGLNGGVSLKWKSDNNAFTATVFVGDVLTLLSKH